MNSEMQLDCLAVETLESSVLEFSTDGFRTVNLHDRQYLVKATENGELVALPQPKIAQYKNGPDLYLNVVLLGPPNPQDVFLSPHVAGGRLSLTVDASISSTELNALSQKTKRKVITRPSERISFELRTPEKSLAKINHTLTKQATLESALSKALSSAVMSAMSHGPSDLEELFLDSVFYWRESTVQQMLLRGDWGALLTLTRHLAKTRECLILEEDFITIARQGIDQKVLHLQDQQGNPSADYKAAAEMLRRTHAMFLQRQDMGYIPKTKAMAMPLSIKQTVNIIKEKNIATTLDLLPAIKASMAASHPNKHLNITVLGNREISRSTLPERRKIHAGIQPIKPGISLSTGKDPIDAQLVTRPFAKQNINLLNTDFAWNLNPKSLPVFNSKNAADQILMRDRLQTQWRWYIPEWALQLQTHDTADGPFSFELEQRGFTANAEPAFFAQIKFELIAHEPKHLINAISKAKKQGLTVKQCVPLIQSIYLEIPYINESTGQIARRRLKASFEQKGQTILCKVQVQHDTVRLAYGALSHPDFQSEPARVHIETRFNAYEASAYSSSLKKRAAPLGVVSAGVSTSPLLNQEITYTQPTFTRPTTVGIGHKPGLNRPNLVTSPLPIKPQPTKPKYQFKLTQFGNAQNLDLLVPCDSYSQAYRQGNEDGSIGIGCLQPLLLGQTSPDLLQEIADLRSVAFRVYRQLAQPDRFLVLPSSYHLTRRMVSEGEFTPALGLYSVNNPNNTDENLFTFDAHLEPSITAAELKRLQIALNQFSPSPQLDFPSEVDLAEQELTLSTEGAHSFITDGPFFNVSIRANLSEALIIKARLESSGIIGNAVFTLADGTRLEPSVIKIALNDIGGPWPSGPVISELKDNQILLTNHSESAQEIVSVELLDPTRLLLLDTVIAAGATMPFALDSTHSDAIVASIPSQVATPKLNEMRIFSELIRKQVAFFAPFDLTTSQTPAIEVRAYIVGIDEEISRVLEGQQNNTEIEFELPLTATLSSLEMVYTLVYRNAQGEEHETLTDTIELSVTSLVSIPYLG